MGLPSQTNINEATMFDTNFISKFFCGIQGHGAVF